MKEFEHQANKPKTQVLTLLRHGESEWNRLNLFTGWVDVPLSKKGIEEALEAGRMLADKPVDLIFTSTLGRALATATLAMSLHKSGRVPITLHPEEPRSTPPLDLPFVPVITSPALNERFYGDLQGRNKQEAIEKYGLEQVQLWRRSYDVQPPGGESLKETAERTLPYLYEAILPEVKKGKSVWVVAHGNSLRSIVMALQGLSPEEIVSLEIPTGEPLVYDLSRL